MQNLALVAHDNRKADLIDWVSFNWEEIVKHKIYCTGTTGKLVEKTLQDKCSEHNCKMPELVKLKSGPLGGDQQMGALITENEIDLFIFLWDPMQPQAHDVDVKALLRIAVLYNVPTACNRSTADYMISSPLIKSDYQPVIKDYTEYINRDV